MKGIWLALLAPLLLATPLAAQDSLPPSRITNRGVVRATAATDSVFINRTRLADTVDIGDFASFLLANIGAPPFSDSLGFTVIADSQRVRILGRLSDFPADSRAELGPIFAFLDPSSPVLAEVSMLQADSGIIVFRLERLSVHGYAIPDVLLLAALAQMKKEYPKMLSADGREFLVAMPHEGHARLIRNAIVLTMPAKP